MLTMDSSLGRLIPVAPLFLFKRATSIATILVKSEFKDESGTEDCKYTVGVLSCVVCVAIVGTCIPIRTNQFYLMVRSLDPNIS